MRLWPILQDLHQLRGIYGAEADTFLSNAGCVQLFNVNDVETAEWVSRMLGETTVYHHERAVVDEVGSAIYSDADNDFAGQSANEIARRPLLTPDEVRRLPSDRMLLFLSGRAPVLATKVRYYEDREFKGLFDRA